MKPQLIIQDLQNVGKQNQQYNETLTRLEKTGSWKRQRVIALLPAGSTIPAKVALSHWNLAAPPNNSFVRMLALGMEVGEAYSTAIEQILMHPELSTWEYILTIEHDNMPPWDGLLRLCERMEEDPNLSCVGGLYYTKGEGGVAQIWGDPKDPIPNFRPQLPDPDGKLVECCGTGMGFNLWRLSMFKDERLRKPWFVTQKREGIATQDLYFWTDARKYGYRCAVDCSVHVGHYSVEDDIVY